jgi:hypothetical protein
MVMYRSAIFDDVRNVLWFTNAWDLPSLNCKRLKDGLQYNFIRIENVEILAVGTLSAVFFL